MKKFILIPVALLVFTPIFPVNAAKLIYNPREIAIEKLIRGQSQTLVIADDVNVRQLPTTFGRGGFVFATLSKGDRVYVLGCEGFSENYYWVHIYIPELKELGYVAAQFLENNYNNICRP